MTPHMIRTTAILDTDPRLRPGGTQMTRTSRIPHHIIGVEDRRPLTWSTGAFRPILHHCKSPPHNPRTEAATQDQHMAHQPTELQDMELRQDMVRLPDTDTETHILRLRRQPMVDMAKDRAATTGRMERNLSRQ